MIAKRHSCKSLIQAGTIYKALNLPDMSVNLNGAVIKSHLSGVNARPEKNPFVNRANISSSLTLLWNRFAGINKL